MEKAMTQGLTSRAALNPNCFGCHREFVVAFLVVIKAFGQWALVVRA